MDYQSDDVHDGEPRVERLREITLAHLGVEEEDADDASEVVATVLAPRDIEGDALAEVAVTLAERVREGAQRIGKIPASYSSAVVDFSDHADCVRADGSSASAFVTGERCYRIVIRVVS